jgi:hypothetical protein
MADKTHWDCDKPALSKTFALSERVGAVDLDGRVERDGPGAAWLSILIDFFNFFLTGTPDSSLSSEGIET